MSENKLAVVTRQYDVNLAIAQPIIDAFMPHYETVIALAEEAASVSVTDATQVTEIKRAYVLRMKLKNARCAADAVRKQEKETYLRIGNCIQGVYKTIAGIAEPAEEKLEAAEKFAERAEAARKMALGRARYDQLITFGVPPYLYALDEISEVEFQEVLAKEVAGRDAKLKAEAEAKSAAAKAEATRIAESRRISMENARLRKEREEADKKAKEERTAREAAEERAATLRQAEEARTKAEADKIAAEKRAAEKARRKAESAPDAEKLAAYAAALASVPQPTLASEDGRTCLETIRTNVADMIAWIHEEAKKL